jgi:hypothetical protein
MIPNDQGCFHRRCLFQNDIVVIATKAWNPPKALAYFITFAFIKFPYMHTCMQISTNYTIYHLSRNHTATIRLLRLLIKHLLCLDKSSLLSTKLSNLTPLSKTESIVLCKICVVSSKSF